MLRKSLSLASPALPVMAALVAWLVSGCGENPEPELEAVYPREGNAYVHDPAFRADMQRQRDEQKKIVEEQLRISKRMRAIEAEVKGDKAEAEKKSEEYRALKRAAEENAKSFQRSRVRSEEIVRARIRKAAEDSERVKRGEAKAIDISKENKVNK